MTAITAMVTAEKTFTARHAVQLDPRYKEVHEREWTLMVGVTGPELDPGWIMPFEDIEALLALVIPSSGNLNELEPGGTSEALARAFWRLVEARLPSAVELAQLELTEAPRRTVVLERRGSRFADYRPAEEREEPF